MPLKESEKFEGRKKYLKQSPLTKQNPACGGLSDLLNVCASIVPILYHEYTMSMKYISGDSKLSKLCELSYPYSDIIKLCVNTFIFIFMVSFKIDWFCAVSIIH